MSYKQAEVVEASTAYFGGETLPANSFTEKYALSEGDDFFELTPDDMHWRLAREFARADMAYPNYIDAEEFYFYLKNFECFVPGGSVMSGLGNPYALASLGNCFGLPGPEDSVTGIGLKIIELMNISKRRGGSGLFGSTMRPNGAKVSNAAKTSSGAVSWLPLFSKSGEIIGNNGRRAAYIFLFDPRHPDIIEFINCKQDTTVLPAANISVSITDEFMAAVKANADWDLVWEGEVFGTIPAIQIWDQIAQAAWRTGEPGLLFWDNYCNTVPVHFYKGYESVSCNPCVVGDTKVALADGRGYKTFSELVQEGIDVPVYCYDNNKNIVIRTMRQPRVTGQNMPIYKVTLDNGESLRVTGNHKFLVNHKGYVQAKDLTVGASLAVMHRRLPKKATKYAKVTGREDYSFIYSGKSKVDEHRAIAAFHNNVELSSDLSVHHIDFDSTNNAPENLRIMTHDEHNQLHGSYMLGKDNVMSTESRNKWSSDKTQAYNASMSDNTSGAGNPTYYGVTNDDLKEHALKLTALLGRRFSTPEWLEYATANLVPKGFSQWRKDNLGSVMGLAKWAALELGYDLIDADPRSVKTYKTLVAQGYDCSIADGHCCVTKQCEVCGSSFTVKSSRRAVSICSSRCACIKANNTPGRKETIAATRQAQAQVTKDNQLSIYTELKFSLKRDPFLSEWAAVCKTNGVPFRLGKASASFSGFKELKEQAASYNHRVVSVEADGYETVYNGTVDEFHNYFIGGFSEVTNNGRNKEVYVNNLNCGELLLGAYESCKLGSINLKSFVKDRFTPEARFDFEKFKKTVHMGTRMLDNLVDLETEALTKIINACTDYLERELFEKIRDKAVQVRRIGLGTHGLADCLACLRIKYDSDEGLSMAAQIYDMLRDESYRESIRLAKQRGPFPIYDYETDILCPWIKTLPQDIQEDMRVYGRRNGALLTCAPTGTVSILCQTSSGGEPVFANFYYRYKKINNPDQIPDRVDANGVKWERYQVFHKNVQEFLEMYPEYTAATLPDYFVTADSTDISRPAIDWHYRLQMQNTIGQRLDGGVSSTLNLCENTSVETVKDIYMEAYDLGIKGLTIYRDGSRAGVMTTTDVEQKDKAFYIRPDKLPCDIYYSTVKDGDEKVPYVVIVGLKDGEVFEVFGGRANGELLSKKHTKGEITKHKKRKVNRYELVADGVVICSLGEAFHSATHSVENRLMSLALRNTCGVEHLISQLEAEPDSDMTAYNKVVARCLKSYVADGVAVKVSGGAVTCPACESEGSLRYQEHCCVCMQCGYSGCG